MNTERQWSWVAGLLWVATAIGVALLLSVRPHPHILSVIYHHAVANWWARQPVYTGPLDFNYLPTFIPLFGLCAWLPQVVGDILWRWLAMAGFAVGLWRCVGVLADSNRARAFAIVTFLALPICLGAFLNGQSSAQLAASLVLAAACLQRQQWGGATFWLCLSLVCKPLGLPAIGLAWMAFPRLWWRLTIGLVLVAAAPYLFGPPAYVTAQYAGFAQNITQCFDTTGRSFADINGVLAAVNLKLTGGPSLIVRLGAAAAFAAACWSVRRLDNDLRRVLFWLGFTGSYIMLFTPMNESNSYVMLAPALALWAWWHLSHGTPRTAQAIAAMPLTMALLPNLIRLSFGKLTGNAFAKFLDPFLTLIFLGIVFWQLKNAVAALHAGQPAGLENRATPAGIA